VCEIDLQGALGWELVQLGRESHGLDDERKDLHGEAATEWEKVEESGR
jgi:hypothetical protein